MHLEDPAVVMCAWMSHRGQGELHHIFRRLPPSPPPAARQDKRSGRSWIGRSSASSSQ
jgi:hypothetical protein